jgi:hypothetical protein
MYANKTEKKITPRYKTLGSWIAKVINSSFSFICLAFQQNIIAYQ